MDHSTKGNNKPPPSLTLALNYISRGWAPIPVPARSKRPVLNGWQWLRLDEASAGRYFTGEENVGMLTGEPSGWLVDVDLDHPLAVELAPQFLPPTTAVFGRSGKPRSHWLYLSPSAKTKKCQLPDKTMIVELRSTGCQTIMPGGVHECGEPIEWVSDGEPAHIEHGDLARAVDELFGEVAKRLAVEAPKRAEPSSGGHSSGLDALARATAYVAKSPGAAKGGRNETAYRLACVLVSDFDLPHNNAWPLLVRWNETCSPPLDEHELRSTFNSAGKRAKGPRGAKLNNEWRKPTGGAAKTYTVGGLEISSGAPRQTSSKLIVPVRIYQNGTCIDDLTITSAASSRKDAERAFARHTNGLVDDAARLVGTILADARDRLETSASNPGDTIADILSRTIPGELKLTYRTNRGAYSEALGCELSRGSFLEMFTRHETLFWAAAAADAPIDRGALMSAVERELKILWGTLLSDLKNDSAELFRAAMVKLWNKPTQMGIVARPVKTEDQTREVQLTESVSLIQQFRRLEAAGKVSDAWTPLHPGRPAWCREDEREGGELYTLFAMRYELAFYVGVELPGVHNQLALTALGTKYGVIDPDPGACTAVRDAHDNERSGKHKRISVLSRDLTEDLLHDPTRE